MSMSSKEFNLLYHQEIREEDWITVPFWVPIDTTPTERDNEIMQWIEDIGLQRYTYDTIDIKSGLIHFLHKDDASLFKLTWC